MVKPALFKITNHDARQYRGSQLRIWDIRDPQTTRLHVAMEFEATSVKPVAVEYPILYLEIGVSGQRSAFAAIDISDPTVPVVLGRSELNGSIQEV